MAATTTQQIMLKQLINDFPHLNFISGELCKWSPRTQTITYTLKIAEDNWDLLHECSHAQLQHNTYSNDIDLLTKEADAWFYAQGMLGPRYNLIIPDSYVEYSIETYRLWLYERSKCPNCSQTCLQTKTSTYSCHNCGCLWRVNDARQCAVRRSVLTS